MRKTRHYRRRLSLVRCVAPLFGLWDSDAVSAHRPSFYLMRLDLVSSRFLMKAGSVVALWLLSASVGYAAPGPRRAVVGRACSPHTAPVRKLVRHPKSFGGPVAPPSKRAMAGLSDATARLQRGTRANLDDDDEAIQSDASAARIDADDRPVPALRPLGLLHGSVIPLPRPHTFSPRSPRGPPKPT